MMAGQAFEIESRWRPDTSATVARDMEQRRIAMEARTAQRAAVGQTTRPSVRDRLAASFRAVAGATTPAR